MRTEHLTAFDQWLSRALASQFGAAEGEALPDELMRLLPPQEDGAN